MNDRRDSGDRQYSLLREALERADLTVDELWLRYFGLGGTAGLLELEGYLEKLLPLASLDRDILAVAVNERLDELTWPHRVPYSHSVREPLPATGPLTALVDLLNGARAQPAEYFPRLTSTTARSLGVTVQIYLADEHERLLLPLPGAAASDPTAADEALSIDATVGGRAFRDEQVLVADSDSANTLWVPLIDDIDRLGVLRVGVADVNELHDPALRQQVEWLMRLLAHLLTLAARYGDLLHTHTRAQPRRPAAELIWNLVPPPTGGVPGFILAARIEPSHRAGGDAYDYALSSTTADLAIFDAMGHDLNAGLITTTALAASRAARRKGSGIHDQAQLVDELIRQHFGRGTFATGVLASLDLRTGLLRYLSAGHLNPLLLRDGKVVKRLAGGRRLPFGLGSGTATVGEESLEPGDWLVLHTDGLTEARDATGLFFGDQRLIDFLEREASAQRPPPETVRRLIHAVLDHHRGELVDDATVILGRWLPGVAVG